MRNPEFGPSYEESQSFKNSPVQAVLGEAVASMASMRLAAFAPPLFLFSNALSGPSVAKDGLGAEKGMTTPRRPVRSGPPGETLGTPATPGEAIATQGSRRPKKGRGGASEHQ
ncbi:MAG: hypothetical protein CM15mP103_05090 [Gammaproteobacteria bacterium]|nr:MAG: hypothetical protein CM15mP103_05090 [Gammaproteobacteria bacterium]